MLRKKYCNCFCFLFCLKHYLKDILWGSSHVCSYLFLGDCDQRYRLFNYDSKSALSSLGSRKKVLEDSKRHYVEK